MKFYEAKTKLQINFEGLQILVFKFEIMKGTSIFLSEIVLKI